MAARLKTTAFTRILIMLIILVPLAYFGASYLNGEDPMDNINKLLGNNDAPKTEANADVPNQTSELEACQKENRLLQDRIKSLEAQLKAGE